MTASAPGMTIRPMGDTALLVEAPDLTAMQGLDLLLRRASRAGDLPAIRDQVPAARTVLLVPENPGELTALRDRVQSLCARVDPAADGPDDAPTMTIDAHYDGPDLAQVARLAGLSADEVIVAHTGATWQVAFCGFSPGFAYLIGGDPRLRVPRRDEPRTRVPAGSIGLAGEFSGVYPRASPGGWQLIGRTDAPIWDPDRQSPALLQPGTRVRFRAVGGTGE